MTVRSDALAGVKAGFPVVPPLLSFGIVAGTVGVQVLSPAAAVGFSVIVFSGTGQLAALELIDAGAPLAVVVLTSLVVNVRFVMYSASLAPYFEKASLAARGLVAYFVVTPNYLISVTRYDAEPETHRLAYYLGVSVPMYLSWQVGTVVGVVFGTSVPESFQLRFIVPLAFIALVVPTLSTPSARVAAAVGGVVALLAGGVPFELGVIVATVAGVAAGVLTREVRDE